MDLSVIILSYNTKELTKKCLDALVKSLQESELKTEIIVIDNASEDDSPEMLASYKQTSESAHIKYHIILNKENKGFPKGNNQGIEIAKGTFTLLLNSDAIIQDVNFKRLLAYMDQHPQIGVLTVRLNLTNGSIDPASHRGFPTPWNAFCYYSKLEKLFGDLPLFGKYFGGYHQYYKDLDTVHEIDSPTGAFYLSRTDILKAVKGLDEDYFMYGEDIDLSYRIKKKGFKVVYYPIFTTLHMKSVSGIKGQDPEIRNKTRTYFYDSMKIFYKKHYKNKYPSIITKVVFAFIDFKQNHL
ncbi:MAG: glycosyltransferase family 2 protein [Patescibacteria group bacterium]